MSNDNNKHWLYRKENLPKLWIFLIVILILTLIPDFFIHHHANFEDKGLHLDTTWGFYGWFGFITCAAMVLGAKALALLLKRKDTYYNE